MLVCGRDRSAWTTRRHTDGTMDLGAHIFETRVHSGHVLLERLMHRHGMGLNLLLQSFNGVDVSHGNESTNDKL